MHSFHRICKYCTLIKISHSIKHYFHHCSCSKTKKLCGYIEVPVINVADRKETLVDLSSNLTLKDGWWELFFCRTV